MNDANHYVQGVNLHERIASKQLCYVDGLSTGSTFKDEVIKMKAPTLKDFSNALSTALQQTTTATSSGLISRTIVLIDGIDLLLACDSNITSTDIQQVLTEVQSKVHSVIVTCAADEPLLHNTNAAATPLEHEHGSLVRSLAYQAGLVFQLRPLETGHSREVDGTVRVSRGGSWEGSERVLEEGEWLFHVKGDGGVKVWSRGEA